MIEALKRASVPNRKNTTFVVASSILIWALISLMEADIIWGLVNAFLAGLHFKQWDEVPWTEEPMTDLLPLVISRIVILMLGLRIYGVIF